MDNFNKLSCGPDGDADETLCDSCNQPTLTKHKPHTLAARHERYQLEPVKPQSSTRRLSMHLSATFFCFIMFYVTSYSPSSFVHSLKNRYGTITVISAKPCQNALGQFGTCMFMWDCIKSEGVHLGTCSDRFLFGSCCYHNSSLSLALVDSSNQRLNTSANQMIHLTAATAMSNSQNGSLNYSDESHSRPQTSNVKLSNQQTSTPILSSQSTLTQTTQTLIDMATAPKPDRLFLSSHSSSGSPDYVTTSSAASSNYSTSDHIVSLNYDVTTSQSNPSVATNTSTREQQQVNKLDTTQIANNDWNSSGGVVGTKQTTTTTTTSTTTTTPEPISYQQLSGHSQNWNQIQLNYTTTQTPSTTLQEPSTSSSGHITHLKPVPQNESNQIMAYQLVSRPPLPLPSMTTMRPSSPVPISDLNQTQRPASSSWLSRPSLLANAIFHSFKPYLNPNRQRPTYRPYMGGGFRPQHQQQRPPVASQQQHQRPLLFLPASIAAANQQQQSQVNSESSNSIQLSESKIPTNFLTTNPNSTMFGSSPATNQQDNSDHHIVNPSTMTDRRRPVDKNNQLHGNLLSSIQSGDLTSQTATSSGTSIITSNNENDDQRQQQHQSLSHQYEMLNGHGLKPDDINNLVNTTSGYSLQSNSSAMVHTLVPMSDYSIDSNNTTTTTTSTTNATTTLATQPSLMYDYNSSNAGHQGSYGNHSMIHYQNLQQHQGTLNQGQHQSINDSVASPSYPLINSGFLVTPPVSDGSSDEIHGLMVGGHQYELPNKQDSLVNTASNNNGNSLLNQANSNYLNAQQSNSFITPNKDNGASLNINSGESHMLPSNTIMIGNIDEPTLQQSPSASESVPMDGHTTTGTISSSLQSGGPVPQPPDINTGLTTTGPSLQTTSTSTTTTTTTTTLAPTLNSRPHHHNYQHQVAPSNVASNKEATCGVTAMYPQTKVVGGKNAAFGAWPWQVSVRKVSFFGFSSTHRCGGAVISSEWIATAGHCVEDLALQSIRIRVGEYDFSTMAEPYPHIERGARKKVVHPKYNFYTYENDLALVQLDQPLQFSPHVAPICLPPDNIDLVGRNATVTGWGRLNEGGTLPTILQEVIVPIVSNDKCRDMFLRAGRPEYIPDIFLCAGYEEGGRDSCQGDSGGPLQVRGDDGRWVLAGIISWGIGCAEPLLVGVCSAIQRFKPWIQSTISATG